MADKYESTAEERAKALADFEAAEAAVDPERMKAVMGTEHWGAALFEQAIASARKMRKTTKSAGVDWILAGQYQNEAQHAVLRVHRVRFQDLERRLKALEDRPAAPGYEGVWQEDKEYPRGVFVTRSGSMWHAKRATKAKPGESADWTLAVKRGSDAR